eukprot:6370276-Prorocentrum_lima.AAC.1
MHGEQSLERKDYKVKIQISPQDAHTYKTRHLEKERRKVKGTESSSALHWHKSSAGEAVNPTLGTCA